MNDIEQVCEFNHGRLGLTAQFCDPRLGPMTTKIANLFRAHHLTEDGAFVGRFVAARAVYFVPEEAFRPCTLEERARFLRQAGGTTRADEFWDGGKLPACGGVA